MEADRKPEDDLPEALRALHAAVSTRLEIALPIRVCEFHFQGAPFAGHGRPFAIPLQRRPERRGSGQPPVGSSNSVLEV